jgi:hypothetical protein
MKAVIVTEKPLRAEEENFRLGRILERLECRELIESELDHDCRVASAETRIVLSSPPHRATPIDEGMQRDQTPPLHFLAN